LQRLQSSPPSDSDPLAFQVETDLSETVTDLVTAEVEAILAPLGVRIVLRSPDTPVAATVTFR